MLSFHQRYHDNKKCICESEMDEIRLSFTVIGAPKEQSLVSLVVSPSFLRVCECGLVPLETE